MLSAGVYLRLSVDRTGSELGVSRQDEDCTALVARRGGQVIERYSDNDTSANGRVVRPGFRQLLADVSTGRIGIIVAWNQDRLLRTTRDRLDLVEICRRTDVTAAFVRGTDIDPTTPSGRLTLAIMQEVAQHELDARQERQERAMRQRAERGIPWVANRPFGYDVIGAKETRNLIIRESEADHVEDAFTQLLAGGSSRGTARRWNAAGIRTTRGNQWTASSVHQILENPLYAGLRAYRGEIVGPGAWKAVVDEATWRAAQWILGQPGRQPPRTAGRKFLGTGIYVCGIGGCGAPLGSGRSSHGDRTYDCIAGARHLRRSAAPVDKLVEFSVFARLSRDDARALLDTHERADSATLLQEKATTLRKRLDELALEFAEGELTASQLRVATARIQENLADVERQMAQSHRSPVLADLIEANDVEARWREIGLDRQRAALRSLLTVRILPTGRMGNRFDPSKVARDWLQP